ncbi:MAG: hypothetical protein MUF37_01485, partial [Methanoregulaceae archaeon]|nr:hypothetical protein [Methanoregulaceae archaeon]
PSQVSGLRHCRLLLRFDFQRSLDARLREIPDLAVGEIAPGGGMNLPASYFAACGQTARHLVDHGLLSPSAATSRLETIQARLDALASAQAKRVALPDTR